MQIDNQSQAVATRRMVDVDFTRVSLYTYISFGYGMFGIMLSLHLLLGGLHARKALKRACVSQDSVCNVGEHSEQVDPE